MPPKVNSLTLAFAAGGAKCAAHAGVLAVLADARLPVGAIAGTSAGGLVGILHALGWSPTSIRDYIADTSLAGVWEVDPDGHAIFGPSKVRARIRQAVGRATFADLKIPVTLVAADVRTRREVRITSGRLDEALAATMAIPGIFSPVSREGGRLVDGGIVNPLPVDVARAMGPNVVAVDIVHHQGREGAPMQFVEVRGPVSYALEIARRLRLTGIMQSVHDAADVTAHRLVEYALKESPPDLVIRPEAGAIGLFAFDRANEAYRLGEAAACAALPQLEALARPRPAPFWQRVFGWANKTERG
jgi:NTE family protein